MQFKFTKAYLPVMKRENDSFSFIHPLWNQYASSGLGYEQNHQWAQAKHWFYDHKPICS